MSVPHSKGAARKSLFRRESRLFAKQETHPAKAVRANRKPRSPRDGRPHERGFLTDGGCIQPVGIGDDTEPCAVWDGERQGQGQADRQAANNRRQHSRNLPSALSRFQKRAVECFGIGKGL